VGTDTAELVVKYTNNHVYGQSATGDCSGASATNCFSGDKTGISQNSIGDAKPIHPTRNDGGPLSRVTGTKWHGRFIY